MYLIVGLGNPESDYAKTRHNMGFNVINKLSEKYDIKVNKSKFKALYGTGTIEEEKVILVKPQTYMNLSGNSVRKVMDYYDVNIDDVLVISDDLDLSIGNYKLKSKGSCGGHNGLRDIESKIGTTEYKRLKIGISNDKDKDTKDYVLGNLSKDDKRTIDNLYKDLCPVIDDYFKLEFTELMNKYNHKNR